MFAHPDFEILEDMATNAKKKQYVLMPDTNLFNIEEPGTSVSFLKSTRKLLVSPTAKRATRLDKRPTRRGLTAGITVLDEVAPNDSLLVNLNADEVQLIAQEQPGLRLVEVVELEPLWVRSLAVTPPLGASAAGGRTPFTIRVLSKKNKAPLVGVAVYAFTDRSALTGVQGVTDKNGEVKVLLPSSTTILDVVETDPPFGFWGTFKRRVPLSNGSLDLLCDPIDLGAMDARDAYNMRGSDKDGMGVVVGVIDTGVNPHTDLMITSAVNVVPNQLPTNVGDQLGHGTHVCGIIAGRGPTGTAARGIAPGVELRVYKVFKPRAKTADSFSIAKAIRRAVEDGCDLINLSLGTKTDVNEILRQIRYARANGVVCIAAAGNDGRQAVRYPAAYSQVLSVTALGRKGTYPMRAIQKLGEVKPHGTDMDNYFAEFSNLGFQVGLIGPGVGVVSTMNNGYAAMDGTSMACPAMTGMIAKFLGKNKKILNMKRTQKRSDAIITMTLRKAQTLGFAKTFEGSGILV
ncbi:S8 family serine peptidase [Massilia jejuensis]|uniref:S8 family serine peptidase n=1 Tax=Massilia jejuensis TaxID=648894 RepID=A0ABW0PND4_9BURK